MTILKWTGNEIWIMRAEEGTVLIYNLPYFEVYKTKARKVHIKAKKQISGSEKEGGGGAIFKL